MLRYCDYDSFGIVVYKTFLVNVTTLNPTKTLHLLIVIYSGEKGESIVKAKEDQNSQNAQ